MHAYTTPTHVLMTFSPQVEHLLRRHLLQSIAASGHLPLNSVDLGTHHHSAAEPAPLSSAPQSPASTADVCASLDLLFSSAAQVLSGGEDAHAHAMAVDAHVGHADAESIQLDDVLDAAFLDDAAVETAPAPTVTPAADAASGVGGSGSGVGRWDLMSVGAFRQTREAGWEARHHAGGGAPADFGAALRPAPMGAMLWQQGSRAGGGVKGIKHAKRRQMMLGAAAMSSPLILPSASVAASPSLSSTSKEKQHHSHGHNHNHQQNQHQNQQQEQQQKSRRELRRERKVLKKALKVHGGPPPAQHAQHAHQFHAHAHHPNSKLRGAGAAQRANFFGGAVPPLNL